MSSTLTKMRTSRVLLLALPAALALATMTGSARADTPSAVAAPAPASAPARGLAVLALPGAGAAAWSLAHEVYANPGLRNPSVDEAHARVLAGEHAPEGAPKDLRDLSETCAAIKGDDAPSRQLLRNLAQRFGVRGIVVVANAADGSASARVFLADADDFDAAQYLPSPAHAPSGPEAAPLPVWSATVQSLARAYASPQAPQVTLTPLAATTPATAPAATATNALAPIAAVQEAKARPASSKQFYESAWFWGALGAAAFAGGAVFFATRDNTPTSIHLEMQVPR